MRRILNFLSVLGSALVLAVASGCGDSGTGSNGSEAGGCLSALEVEEQVNGIAEGVEGSEAEVEEKQDQIQEIRSREC
jgi:hypothetical protein